MAGSPLAIGRLILDRVKGAEHVEGIGTGRTTRTALFVNAGLPAGVIADKFALIRALYSVGLPQKGSSLDPGNQYGYKDWFLKTYIVTALQAKHYVIQMIYEWRGLKIQRDTSSLQTVPTNVHPDGTLLTVKYKNAADTNDTGFTKPFRASVRFPLRHYTVSKTIDFQASPDVVGALRCVNKVAWQGFPPGCWQLSDLDGETLDEGLTYTYTAVWSTQANPNDKIPIDWSVYEFFTDQHSRPFGMSAADQTALKALRAKPYAYTVDTSVNGVTKTGFYPMVDFFQIFGV